MVRYWVMSRLGLVEPLVRWQRRIELGQPATSAQRPTPRTAARLAVRSR
jgi:hypothetical protein